MQNFFYFPVLALHCACDAFLLKTRNLTLVANRLLRITVKW